MFIEKFSLRGLVGIVTGAGQGLGRTYCQAFAESGADLVVAEINAARGAETAEQVKAAGRRSLFVETDVRRKDSVERMVEKTIAELGRIDFLVNNAGLAEEGAAVSVTEEGWRDIVDINLSGTFYCCQAVGRHMIAQKSGSIVNISSISAIIANRGRRHVAYNVAKAGVSNLTKMLACEWAEHNIRVNGIAPGYTATEKIKPFLEDPEFGGEVIPWIPMRRPAKPEEIAPLAIFLVSPASSYMTGTTVVIDGGFTCW